MENDSLRLENVGLKQKIDQMLAVMHIASLEDDQTSREEEVNIIILILSACWLILIIQQAFASQLIMENENLLQLLQISERMSNVQ